MIKHTQTIRRQQPTNCLNVFDHFVGLALKVLNSLKALNKGAGKTLLMSTCYTATLQCVRDRP